MPISPSLALRRMREAFQHLAERMQSMHPDCQVRPSDRASVIQHSAGMNHGVSVECRPVACRVPERASHANAPLYIAFTGRITFAPETVDRTLVTASYSTKFAYFLVRGASAVHALGGHYDFASNTVAHPRAHMQFQSQADMYSIATDLFPSIAKVPLEFNVMERILNRVRPPSAQMDFLSFMLQICADHLVDENSTESIRASFEQLAASCSPLMGYHINLPEGLCRCHRAPHWYPSA